MLPETVIMHCFMIIVVLFTMFAIVFTAAVIADIVRDMLREP